MTETDEDADERTVRQSSRDLRTRGLSSGGRGSHPWERMDVPDLVHRQEREPTLVETWKDERILELRLLKGKDRVKRVHALPLFTTDKCP